MKIESSCTEVASPIDLCEKQGDRLWGNLCSNLYSTHIRHLSFDFFTSIGFATLVWNLISLIKCMTTNIPTLSGMTIFFLLTHNPFLCAMGLIKRLMFNFWVMIGVEMSGMSLGLHANNSLNFISSSVNASAYSFGSATPIFTTFWVPSILTLTKSSTRVGRCLHSLGSSSVWMDISSFRLWCFSVLTYQRLDVRWSPLILPIPWRVGNFIFWWHVESIILWGFKVVRPKMALYEIRVSTTIKWSRSSIPSNLHQRPLVDVLLPVGMWHFL